MADMPETDAQDVAETFDEDNTNLDTRRLMGGPDAEQAEDLPDVYDATRANGDADEDESEIGDDMDDDEIVAASDDSDTDDDDAQNRAAYSDRTLDGGRRRGRDEVELAYAGDLTNVSAGGASTADMESETLDDDDLKELHYQEDAK